MYSMITGNTGGTYKLADLNVEADASGDDEDDIDWEEGWTETNQCFVCGFYEPGELPLLHFLHRYLIKYMTLLEEDEAY